MMILSNTPKLDLHGFDRNYAKMLIEEFISDNYKMKNYQVLIVHGNGTGILRKITQETLRQNKYVEEYKIDNFNSGCTIVKIKIKVWQYKYIMLE